MKIKNTVQKIRIMYLCPFCKKNIVSSKKTEIHYQNRWINGCSECFALSIGKPTMKTFQTKNYHYA